MFAAKALGIHLDSDCGHFDHDPLGRHYKMPGITGSIPKKEDYIAAVGSWTRHSVPTWALCIPSLLVGVQP